MKTVFVVTGVWRECTEEQLKHMMIEENDDILRNFGNRFLLETELVRRRRCNNKEKEHVSFETAKDIFEYILSRRQINIDLETRYIEEESRVIICYNCQRYGHVSRFCRDRLRCKYCGEGHDGRECQASRIDCQNCREHGVPPEEREHSARDRRCPTYVRREQLARLGLTQDRNQTANIEQKRPSGEESIASDREETEQTEKNVKEEGDKGPGTACWYMARRLGPGKNGKTFIRVLQTSGFG